MRRRQRCRNDGEVLGVNDSMHSVESRSFKHAGKFACIGRPVVLQQTRGGARRKTQARKMIARADAVQKECGKRRDVFAALTQRRNGEANSREAKGELRQKKAFAGHLTEGSLRGGNQRKRLGVAALQRPEHAEQQSLSGGSEQIDAIEIDEPGDKLRIDLGEQPVTGAAALEVGTRMSGSAV